MKLKQAVGVAVFAFVAFIVVLSHIEYQLALVIARPEQPFVPYIITTSRVVITMVFGVIGSWYVAMWLTKGR